jgi:hypothetical protein
MALSIRQAWRLRGIERRLRQSEPGLARMLEDFAQVGPDGHPDDGRPGPLPEHSDRRWHAWLHYIAVGSVFADPSATADGSEQGHIAEPLPGPGRLTWGHGLECPDRRQ